MQNHKPPEGTPAWEAEQARLQVGHQWIDYIRAQLKGDIVPSPPDDEEEPF